MTTEPRAATSGSTARDAATGWVRPLCWTAVALEGFDLVVLGVVMPVLLRDPTWDLDPAGASVVVTVGLLGVMVGALAVGPIADVIGRRATMIGTVAGFSVLTLACAFAPNPEVLGGLRFLAGHRARRSAARRARAGRRVRTPGPRQQLHDDPHDRLPRRRGAHGPARHPADPRRSAGRRCSSPARCPR